ncbi:MAG: hypothetical protein WC464_07250 [Bdellovibrionales bacterium]
MSKNLYVLLNGNIAKEVCDEVVEAFTQKTASSNNARAAKHFPEEVSAHNGIANAILNINPFGVKVVPDNPNILCLEILSPLPKTLPHLMGAIIALKGLPGVDMVSDDLKECVDRVQIGLDARNRITGAAPAQKNLGVI